MAFAVRFENLFGIDEPTGSNIGVGFAQRFVECGTVGFVEPVAGVKRQKLQFRTVGKIRRLVDDKAPGTDTSFDGHAEKGTT